MRDDVRTWYRGTRRRPCTDRASFAASFGDSGSPVFSINADGRATMRGIFFAGAGAFAPIDRVLDELFQAQVATRLRITPLDYDLDDDGLIEVSGLAQLNAIRWDLDGDGSANDDRFNRAFPTRASSLGCPSSGCTGYELVADLDFDTDGDGSADSGDDYWNGGAGWEPIGTPSARFRTTFDGNGHTISSLFINRANTDYVGPFGSISSTSVIRNTGLLSINVAGRNWVGGLVGYNASGRITTSYATGAVRSAGNIVGGLVGVNSGRITASYATGSVTGSGFVGGLVGINTGTITATYAAGSVTGNNSIGGLGGYNDGTNTASYWNTETSGQPTSAGGVGQTTSELQSPTGYAGIYADWNVNIDDADGGDNPWDFGTASQYPTINYVPTAPTMLEATPGDGQVTLTWATAASILAITQYQFQVDGSGRGWQDIPGSDADTTSYTVTGLTNGQSYTFRVRAVNSNGNGAEASVSVVPTDPVDYDADDDGLIEVSSLAQLNAIRWDRDGDGSAADTGYAAAFPTPCPAWVVPPRAAPGTSWLPTWISTLTATARWILTTTTGTTLPGGRP